MMLSVILLAAIAACDLCATADILSTTSGRYTGRTAYHDDRMVKQYLGIEYGRVSRRFERAEPIRRAQNDSVIEATAHGPVCKPSGGECHLNRDDTPFTTSCSVTYGIFETRAMSAEQCLRLNVFIPTNATDGRKKAIFMWIHGGSGQVGSGNVFDGTVLAAVGDIIVITFNYRLNLFGFLSSGDRRLEGNLGLYDQAMVLDWIYENSATLGGDPERITVGGHSTGAPHAYYLAMSPWNGGRIRRLVLQSGCPFNVWSHINAGQAMDRFRAVSHENGCGDGTAFDDSLTCLREKDFHQLRENEHPSYSTANHTNVVLAGTFMHPSLADGDALANLDILMGSTDDESNVKLDQESRCERNIHAVRYLLSCLRCF